MLQIKSILTATVLLLSTWGIAQQQSWLIIVDQFGYLPDAPKIAVLKDPQTGFDSWQSFTPGSSYALVNVATKEHVFTASPVSWNSGATDGSSGDKVWWFDFTEVTATGNYYILDVEKDVRSFEFRISPSVYNEVLKHALRTFYYQRAGFAKQLPFAEKGWVDEASHLKPGQDLNARLYNATTNAETERDVSGGWYDAGDFNKYTSWTADYVVDMLLAYLERPEVWTDDFNIPESGNGIPDLLDEALWGLEHLVRLQNEDGGVLSIVGVGHASPPSAATGPSRYGPPSTSATLTSAAAFALAAKVFADIEMEEKASDFAGRAVKAWQWADANPEVLFQNNHTANGSQGLGAGQQEVNEYGRLTKKLRAAAYLFQITGEESYRAFFDANYTKVNMLEWNFAFPFQTVNQDMLLYYTSVEGATPAVVTRIKQVYGNAMASGSENFPAINSKKDPYMAHLKDYTWGSNGVKCRQGSMFYNLILYDVRPDLHPKVRGAAIGYINYIHGVNPLNMVYLSNMYKYGAKAGVNEFYHTWFSHGSSRWDRAGESVYGPAPGFLTGGPNPSYDWDGCCPSNCGSANNNAQCYSQNIMPPKDQPAQKSYKDFNNSWPLNSWSVTENSNGYQLPYIRLLAQFVNPGYDCNGDPGGTALIDICGSCAGGNTGIEPETVEGNCVVSYLNIDETRFSPFRIYPNPTDRSVSITSKTDQTYSLIVTDLSGRVHIETESRGELTLDIHRLIPGIYMMILKNPLGIYSHKLVKN